MNIKVEIYDAIDIANILMTQRYYESDVQKSALITFWRLVDEYGFSRVKLGMMDLEKDIRADMLVPWFSNPKEVLELERTIEQKW